MRFLLTRYRLRNTVIAGALAIAGAVLVFLYVASYRDDVESGAELTEVFVAAKDIPEGLDGGTVAGDYLRKDSVLKRNVIPGAIVATERIAGLATSQTILEGEQITIKQFHPAAEQGVLANISGNRRAVTFSSNPNALLSGIVKDGDRVDVLANIPFTVRTRGSSSGDLRRVATRIILRNLLVLEAPTEGSGGGLGGENSSSITLALSDKEAQKLLFAAENGTWWLMLRPVARPGDSPESVETIESILTDGLGDRSLEQLTSGFGAESISSGD